MPGTRQHHLHRFTPGAGGQEPPTLPTARAGRRKQPVPGGPSPGGVCVCEILAPRRAFEGKKMRPSESQGCPQAVPPARPTARGGRLSSLMLCCFPAPGKRFFYPLQPGLHGVSATFSGVLNNRHPLPPSWQPPQENQGWGRRAGGGGKTLPRLQVLAVPSTVLKLKALNPQIAAGMTAAAGKCLMGAGRELPPHTHPPLPAQRCPVFRQDS